MHASNNDLGMNFICMLVSQQITIWGFFLLKYLHACIVLGMLVLGISLGIKVLLWPGYDVNTVTYPPRGRRRPEYRSREAGTIGERWRAVANASAGSGPDTTSRTLRTLEGEVVGGKPDHTKRARRERAFRVVANASRERQRSLW